MVPLLFLDPASPIGRRTSQASAFQNEAPAPPMGRSCQRMLTEAGVAPLLLKSRSPHPPASAGTFSLWEKEDRANSHPLRNPAHHLRHHIAQGRVQSRHSARRIRCCSDARSKNLCCLDPPTALMNELSGDFDHRLPAHNINFKTPQLRCQRIVGRQARVRPCNGLQETRILETLHQPCLHQPWQALAPLRAAQSGNGLWCGPHQNTVAIKRRTRDRFSNQQLPARCPRNTHRIKRRQIERLNRCRPASSQAQAKRGHHRAKRSASRNRFGIK